jgi:hypothetical protein
MYGLEPSAPRGGDHGDVVAAIARFLEPNVYVELGCHHLATFEKVAPHCMHAIGIDREPIPMGPNAALIENGLHFSDTATGRCRSLIVIDTVQYLSACNDAWVDLIFLDSSHEFEATVRELIQIQRVLVPNGVLLMHDTYPPNPDQAIPGRCGDVWKVPAMMRHMPHWECSTLAAEYGLTIARKLPREGGHVAWMP